MLSNAYQHINDEDVFQLRGSLLDKVTFHKMLLNIIKTKPGRELICRVADECEKRDLPIVLTMMKPQKDVLGFCDPDLTVKIANPNQKNFSKAQTNRVILQQTLTLVHELGHALQFLMREDRLNVSLPVKDRFYAQVWNEAEADLWARDVEAELVRIYPGLTRNISLMTRQFKSRIDFVRSFFVKGKNFSLISSGVELIINELMDAHHLVLSSRESHFYFQKLMNRRFERMRLNLKYTDMPLENCFWVELLHGKNLMIHAEEEYAIIDANSNVLALCNQKGRPVQTKAFGDHFMVPLLEAAQKMPLADQRRNVFITKKLIPGRAFVLDGYRINALARPLDRFGEREP